MGSRDITTDFNGLRQLIKNGQLFQDSQFTLPQKECTMRLRLLCSEEMRSQDPSLLSTTGVWKEFPLSQLKSVWTSNSQSDVKEVIL